MSTVSRIFVLALALVAAVPMTYGASAQTKLAPRRLVLPPGQHAKAPSHFTNPSGSLGTQNGWGQTFTPGNSVNSRNSRNARQARQVRQTTQSKCNNKGLCWSDARLKHDIALVAHHNSGLDLYRYRFNGSDQVYVGVMAQDVERVAPAAAVRGEGGFLRVDYRRLGLRLQTWDEWSVSH